MAKFVFDLKIGFDHNFSGTYEFHRICGKKKKKKKWIGNIKKSKFGIKRTKLYQKQKKNKTKQNKTKQTNKHKQQQQQKQNKNKNKNNSVGCTNPSPCIYFLERLPKPGGTPVFSPLWAETMGKQCPEITLG